MLLKIYYKNQSSQSSDKELPELSVSTAQSVDLLSSTVRYKKYVVFWN